MTFFDSDFVISDADESQTEEDQSSNEPESEQQPEEDSQQQEQESLQEEQAPLQQEQEPPQPIRKSRNFISRLFGFHQNESTIEVTEPAEIIVIGEETGVEPNNSTESTAEGQTRLGPNEPTESMGEEETESTFNRAIVSDTELRRLKRPGRARRRYDTAQETEYDAGSSSSSISSEYHTAPVSQPSGSSNEEESETTNRLPPFINIIERGPYSLPVPQTNVLPPIEEEGYEGSCESSGSDMVGVEFFYNPQNTEPLTASGTNWLGRSRPFFSGTASPTRDAAVRPNITNIYGPYQFPTNDNTNSPREPASTNQLYNDETFTPRETMASFSVESGSATEHYDRFPMPRTAPIFNPSGREPEATGPEATESPMTEEDITSGENQDVKYKRFLESMGLYTLDQSSPFNSIRMKDLIQQLKQLAKASRNPDFSLEKLFDMLPSEARDMGEAFFDESNTDFWTAVSQYERNITTTNTAPEGAPFKDDAFETYWRSRVKLISERRKLRKARSDHAKVFAHFNTKKPKDKRKKTQTFR